jgi:hypothetical protein
MLASLVPARLKDQPPAVALPEDATIAGKLD